MKDEIKNRLAQIRAGKIPEGYKNTPIGILKSDWSYAKLNEIVDILTETAGKKQYETLSISAGIGFVNQAKKFGKELSGKQYEKYIVLHKGDFSYNKGNSKAYPQGCIYRLNDRAEAAVPNVFESFRIANGYPEYYEQLFIAGFLNSQLYRFINHGIRDDGLLNLTEKDFYSCIVPVPPLEEQQRIASILSAQDKVIELCERKLEQLKRMKKYYLQNMFPKDGEEYPEIRFKAFTDPWEQRKLGEVTQITMGQSPDGTTYSETPSDYILVQGNADLKDGWVSPRIWTTQKTKSADAGDLIMSVRAPAGAMGKTEYDVVLGRGVAGIKGNEFIFQTLVKMGSDGYWKKLAAGSTFESINSDAINNAVISIPQDIDEQRRIGDYFRNLDHLITLHQRKCEEEKKKKKALQQLLLTGIVRV